MHTLPQLGSIGSLSANHTGSYKKIVPKSSPKIFIENFRTRISQTRSKSSLLEILGLEHLLDQKTLLNTLTIILVEAVTLQPMKKLKNLLKDQEDHLHHKNITNNRNIISRQLRDQCMMQMMKVFFPSIMDPRTNCPV